MYFGRERFSEFAEPCRFYDDHLHTRFCISFNIILHTSSTSDHTLKYLILIQVYTIYLWYMLVNFSELILQGYTKLTKNIWRLKQHHPEDIA